MLRENAQVCVFTQAVWMATSGPHILVFMPLCHTFPYLIEPTFLCRRSIKMAEWEDVELTFDQKQSKIHPYVEEVSLITNWKLAERLLYKQGYKKDPHVTG